MLPSQEAVLTRDFKVTLEARIARDPAFREALLAEAAELLSSGEIEMGKAILRNAGLQRPASR
jgi:hypothetical protein